MLINYIFLERRYILWQTKRTIIITLIKKTLTLKRIKLEEITGQTKKILTILKLKDNFFGLAA